MIEFQKQGYSRVCDNGPGWEVGLTQWTVWKYGTRNTEHGIESNSGNANSFAFIFFVLLQI